MAKLLKLRRGTTSQHGSFTGAEGEVTIDTTKDTAVVHDGSTVGGAPLARENMSNVSSTNIVDRINNSALAGVKVQPNFGTQDIETTGNIDLSDSTGSGNNRIKLGTGDDLEIYHLGSNNNSYITETGSGNLVIGGDMVNLTNAATTESYIRCTGNAQVELYHDNSKKLETFGNGIIVYGPESGGGLINIYADEGDDNADKWRLHANPNGSFYLQNYTSGSWENNLAATGDAGTSLYYDNSVKLETYSLGTKIIGDLFLDNPDNAGKDIQFDSSASKMKFDDGVSANFGSGDDLHIYHDGSQSYITNTTSDLRIRSGYVKLQGGNGENMLVGNQNGDIQLYYDNAKKLHTTSGGIYVTGNIELPDNGELKLGNSGDLNIYHNSSLGNSWISNGTGVLNIRSDGFAIRAQGDSASYINITDDAEVNLYYNNSKKFETSNTGVTITGNILPEANNTRNIGDGTTNFNSVWASNRFRGNDSVSLDLGNSIDLKIRHDGTDNLIEAPTGMDLKIMTGANDNANETCATFENNGSVKLYYDNSHKFSTASTGVTVSNNNDLRIQGGSWAGEYTGGIKLQPNATDSYFQYHGGLYFRKTNGASALTLTQSGDLTATGNVTAYSDARLKTNVNTINDALSIVGKLRGVSFDWKETGKPSIGVIAQEVEEVIPEVVLTNLNPDPSTGETTEVKSVDYGKIVGVLINAINELKAEVDELKGGK